MNTASLVRAPELSLRWIPVWRLHIAVMLAYAIACYIALVLTRRRLLK